MSNIPTFKQFCEKRIAFKKGDTVKNVNPDCEHSGSEGVVVKIEKLPEKGSNKVKSKHNTPGEVVKYKVKNNGKTYENGDELTKTKEQLKKK